MTLMLDVFKIVSKSHIKCINFWLIAYTRGRYRNDYDSLRYEFFYAKPIGPSDCAVRGSRRGHGGTDAMHSFPFGEARYLHR